ncbi:MAG: hypothetical protein DLM55_08330 [Acidimicrobiales bacterium]|nr:MAG: hypothetical protein DLM55_08330 [Acidimicrobiales bacterium]
MRNIPIAVLIPAVMKKAGLVWIEPTGAPASAVWMVWHESTCYVLHGGGEQIVPGLADTSTCYVITRSATTRERTLRWKADVHHVQSETAEWNELLPLLIAKRLNLSDYEQAPQRWARECMLSRLHPSISRAPAALDD